MKTIRSLFIITMAIAMTGFLTSCTKDNDLPNGGVPRINYVRVTNPVSSDSLLTGAFQSNLIAIIGENLQDAQQIWFNDQRASLTPTYVTSTAILVSTPSQIPTVIDNLLKIVFSNGDTLRYAFNILINEPSVASMLSEYVMDGDIATIRGDYFYQPVSVTFPGGLVGELESVQDKIIKVKVPAGAQPGQIIVKTNFGETKSDFWFRDTRNIFLSSDPFTGWWDQNYVVTNPGAGDPPSINGNYIRVKQNIGGWAWTQVAGGPADAMGPISKNVPDGAISKPSDYNLKFEVNTMKPYNANTLKINVGLLGANDNGYQWLPPYDTKGQWQTVTIPFEEVAASYGIPLTVSPTGYWTRLLFHGDGALDADISFDNFRVVPKIIKK